MKKKKSFVVFLIILSISAFLFFLYGSAMIKVPLEILDLQAFHVDNYGRIAFYIDCMNTSHNKTVDSFTLSVICNSDEQAVFQCRILEPKGILPGEDYVSFLYFDEYELPINDISTVEVSVSQVNFTDGSIKEKRTAQKAIVAQVDKNTGTGMFPVRINEVCVYEESATPYKIEPIPFQIDWSNISEEESIIGVTYKVTAKTKNGMAILSANGDDAVYISESYEDPDEWIQPLADNNIVNNSIFATNFRESEAVIYEVSVCRAVTSKGVVWENSNEEDRIVAIMCGKKGYGFNEYSGYPSIQSLIERIDKESQKYALNFGSPEIFIKSQQYCILRYPDIDVRVELSEENEVISDKVGYVYYSKVQYDDREGYIQSISDKLRSLRLCICTSVLTELPYTEVVQKINEYNNNDKAYIDFEDLSYNTFESVFYILDENKDIIYCCVFACGKNLYYPPDKLCWVRESPYESQQNLKVQPRAE